MTIIGKFTLFSKRFSLHTDQIAVPNFAAGAMENWGLVTYKEAGLCYNPEFSTTADKSYIAVIIAHELAHQVKRQTYRGLVQDYSIPVR